jgi:hypothetical protein
MQQPAIETLMTPGELMEILRWKQSRVYLALRKGEIPSLKISHGRRRTCFRVRPSDFERWLQEREND